MPIKRITISVPADLARRIKKAAGKLPVSAWIADGVEGLLEQAELDRLFDEWYRDQNFSAAEEKEADERFERLVGKPPRSRA